MEEVYNPFKGLGVAKSIIAALVILSSAVGGFFMWAWLIVGLWGWFVVPLGVAAIGMSHALGLRLVMAVLTFKNIPQEKNKPMKKLISESLALNIFVPIMIYYLGMFFHSFM